MMKKFVFALWGDDFGEMLVTYRDLSCLRTISGMLIERISVETTYRSFLALIIFGTIYVKELEKIKELQLCQDIK
ncbi:hypothetical protein SAMN02745751_02230 [Dethiosulfatibacter aminovorans DSM 17477]|uniref:Uncharacterized protein n=1 Tax=Dethiosulfatibacter aminovorans DSM 17477 TaxID=1121476 RepID=A0A1M6I8G1_9FIRM|nr:hypothetical protein SAMN02745751_02230 [Dethiosulfatibacter aminovorans DSM 17477]